MIIIGITLSSKKHFNVFKLNVFNPHNFTVLVVLLSARAVSTFFQQKTQKPAAHYLSDTKQQTDKNCDRGT